MGVTGLWKLIDQAGKPVPLETLENKVLAVDISIWLHQVVKGFQDSKGGTIPYAHILGLFHRLCKLLFYKIKPVFVFDGGVPDLKRETIRKRNLSKGKFNLEADRIQQLLLNSLAKEKVIQQALGDAATQLTSPRKKTKPSEYGKEDIYKLPPIPEESIGKSIESSDSSFDEKSSKQYYNINLNSIDVTSKKFLDLPPDVRHDILTDMKEKRKESSWGRLHELPAQSDDFSEFQMKRLLRRRQVQVSLENAEKEMGGKCLSLAEMEAMLSEEGILAATTSASTKAIASNENALFLHIKNLKDAMKEEKQREEAEKKLLSEAKVSLECKDLDESMDEEDEDLQAAIQMSLMDAAPTDNESTSFSKEVKLRPEQKKILGNAVKNLAKDYLIEYGGFNADEVNELIMPDEDDDKPTDSTFRYNDSFILKGDRKTSPIIEIDDSKSESVASVSSDADSDFIEVPNVESITSLSSQEVFPLEMNKEPDADLSKDFRHSDLSKGKEFQIEIKQTDVLEDDLFADIFNADLKKVDKSKATSIKLDDEPVPIDSIKCKNLHLMPKVLTTSPKSPMILDNILENLNAEISDIPTLELESMPSIKSTTQVVIASEKPETLSKSDSLNSILNTLNTEMNEILEIGIDSIKNITASSPPEFTQAIKTDGDELLSSQSSIFKTPKKATDPQADQLPPKVVSPFFRKKTPSPLKRKVSDEYHEEISPKIARILFPSTSYDIEPIELAAAILRDKKTPDQLNSMAAEVLEEKRDREFERNKQDRFGVNITERMSNECKNLLRLFGIPYIVAPMEAESQCAFLDQIKLTDGTITDDSDIWLFGGRTVYKHFFNQQKNVLEFQAENIEKLYKLDRHKLIQLSILVGNDYTNGIQGIGAVTAIEILSEFATNVKEDEDNDNYEMVLLSGLSRFRDWFLNGKNNTIRSTLRSKLKNITIGEDFPNIRVIEALLQPVVDKSDDKFTWGKPDAESIRELAKTTFGWTYSRTDEILLPVLKKLEDKKSQQSIKNFFKITGRGGSEGSVTVSKRVRRAIDIMSRKVNPEEEPVKEKKPRKIVKKKDITADVKKIDQKITKTRKIKTKADEVVKEKIIKLPGEGDDIIPQREFANAEMDKKKQVAIELFQKSKKDQKK